MIYNTTPDIYLDELQYWLAIEHDIAISISALHRNLEDVGLTRKLLHKIALERDELIRAEFRENIEQNFSGTGEELVFVDEASKNDHSTARRYGRSVVGEQANFEDVFVRGDRYSLVAAITKQGYIAAHVVPGSLDSYDFFEFISEQVVNCLVSSSCFDIDAYTVTPDESMAR